MGSQKLKHMSRLLPESLLLNGVFHDKSMLLARIQQKENETDSLLFEVFQFLNNWLDDSESIQVTTSGSTGTPKVISVQKLQMLYSAALTISYFELKPGMSALLCMSPKYIGSRMMIVRAMLGGLNLITTKVESNPLETLETPVDFAAMVPFQFAKAMDESPQKLSYIRTLILGGSDVSHALQLSMKGVETQVFHTYGMTETLSHIALRALNGSNKSDWFTTLPGIRVSLNDNNCLVIEAPMLNDKVLTTNDIAEVNEVGQFKILGRTDDVIVSAGMKIHPNLVENKIATIFQNPYIICSKAHHVAGHIPVLVIEGELSHKQLFNVWKAMEGLLEIDEIPRQIISVRSIQLLESGKIDRQWANQMVENRP